jgi:DNA-binding transcriptional regulator YiaG
MKKQILADSAKNFYIKKFMTLENISKELNVSVRTLRRWKLDGNWDIKRSEYIKSNTTVQEDLYNFGRSILKSIMTDMENDQKVEPARMYTVIKIMNMLKNVKTYNSKVIEENFPMLKLTKPKELSPEIIKEIEEKILGITHGD